MTIENTETITVTTHIIKSSFLLRDVTINCYLPEKITNLSNFSLLLINDGQDLVKMEFENILSKLYTTNDLQPLFCVGIHCSTDRKNEYGTAKFLDYKGRGAKAALFNKFVFNELLPFIRKAYNVTSFKEKAYAGFSLGGLCALDIVWNNAAEFCKVGTFSGSLWWRDKDQDDADFDEDSDRIMHRQVREGNYAPWLKFFFEVGTQDEVADRNNNGVIDSIDDTVSLIEELVKKGYNEKRDINFITLEDGKHDVETWAQALPVFLKWGWGVDKELTD